jgi:hypothetical protein
LRLLAQKDAPALAAPRSSQQNRGFLRREDYYTQSQVATKKMRKTAFLLGEFYIRKTSGAMQASGDMRHPLS